MRFAYVASHLPRRRELVPGPIDAEWIVDERGSSDVVVFVDYESDGTDLLREAGIDVQVSPKRTVSMPDGTFRTADQIQAQELVHRHRHQPFDAVVYDSAHTTDWAWHEPELSAIPRGVAIGPGPVRDVRLVSAVPELFGSHGRSLWAMTGTLATADFLLSDVEVATYGIDGARLPAASSLNPLPTTPAPEGPAGHIALVALSESPAGLASIVERTLSSVATDDNTMLSVIHPDVAIGMETTRDIVWSSIPPVWEGRVRLAEPSSDGVADGLLAQADVVVAARPSDLAVRAVSDAAAKAGSVVLEPAGPQVARFQPEAITKAETAPPVLIAVDGPLTELIDTISRASREAPAIVLHTDAGSWSARRLWRLPGSSRGGLMMVCEPGAYHGEPDPEQPAFDLLGFDAASWPSIRRLLETADTLHQVVGAAGSLAHAHRVNLLVLPAVGAAHGRLAAQPDAPAWVTDTGSLPQPVLPVAGSEPVPPATSEGIKEWVESHGIRDRIRLALPWKWGLLNRAMRGRW